MLIHSISLCYMLIDLNIVAATQTSLASTTSLPGGRRVMFWRSQNHGGSSSQLKLDLQTAKICTRKVLFYTLSHQNVVLMYLAVSCNGTASNSRAAAHTKRCLSSKWGHVKASWPKLFKRCMKATSRASNIPLPQGGHPEKYPRETSLTATTWTHVWQMTNIITAVENLRSTLLFAIGSWGARVLATRFERTIPEAVSKADFPVSYKNAVSTQTCRWGTVNVNSGKNTSSSSSSSPAQLLFQGPSRYRFRKQQILRKQHEHHKEDCNEALPWVSSPSFSSAMLHEAHCKKPKQRKNE